MSDVQDTLNERGSRYGAFKDHAAIAQGLQEVLLEAPNWFRLDPDMRQAMVVFTDKMARILNGDSRYLDNWHDIQGYARLVEARLQKEEEEIKGVLFEPEPLPAPQVPSKEQLEQAMKDMNTVRVPTVFNITGDPVKWGPPHDKANDPAYDVGNYRG